MLRGIAGVLMVGAGVALLLWGWYDPLRATSPRLRDPTLSPDSVALLLSQHRHREPLVIAGAVLVVIGGALYLSSDERRGRHSARTPTPRDG